jgi:hypothetical protein
MDGFDWRAFAVGTAAGVVLALLLGWLFRIIFKPQITLNNPFPSSALCSGGNVVVQGSASSTCNGLTLAQLWSFVYSTLPSTGAPSTPPAGAVSSPPTFPLTVSAVGGTGLVAVWSLYQGYSAPGTVSYSCTGPGGAGGPSPQTMQRVLPLTVNDQLEAIPRAYRVSAGSPFAGPGIGPGAEVMGALSRDREALLEYAPEVSTPVDPVWQAAAVPGSLLRWSLNLLHRNSGLGAVLSVLGLVDGREVRFTWVTSEWRFNSANRLAPEASDPGVPALLVCPA